MITEADLTMSMCAGPGGSCTPRTCSLVDDGSAFYESMQQLALQAQIHNALKRGRFQMEWDTAGVCTRFIAHSP